MHRSPSKPLSLQDLPPYIILTLLTGLPLSYAFMHRLWSGTVVAQDVEYIHLDNGTSPARAERRADYIDSGH
jgi:hypothetical protein